MNAIYKLWQDGGLTDHQALAGLLADLREVESEIAPLEAERSQVREHLSDIIARVGTQVIGDTKLLLTAPSVTHSYDRKALDNLALRLAATHPEIAADLACCRKASARAGSLRIEQVRE